MSVPTLSFMTGWCVPACVTRCPEYWRSPNRRMTLWVVCSIAKRAAGPRQNSRRVIAGSFVTSLTAPDPSCFWVLTCSCVVPTWGEPRVRMKQRVRAVGVRSGLVRVLPPSQRGIIVADAVAPLSMAGGTSIGVRQLKPMSSKLAGALRGSAAKRHGKRARVAEHLFGPGVHRTFPPAAYIYTFCLQLHTHDLSWEDRMSFVLRTVWTHRTQCLGCVHGMVDACRAKAVDWCAPCELSAESATLNFSSV